MPLPAGSDHPPLTADQQALVADWLANNHLVAAVRSTFPALYRACRAAGLTLDDIYQVGVTGLMRAAGSYDPTTGNRFHTYALWWVRGKLGHAVRRSNAGSPPGLVAGDRPVRGSDRGTSLWDFLGVAARTHPSDDPVEADRVAAVRAAVLDVLRTLPGGMRRVLELRYGIDSDQGDTKTLEEVGQILGVTRERVRQLEAQALRSVAVPLQVRCFHLLRFGRGVTTPAGPAGPDPNTVDRPVACPRCRTPFPRWAGPRHRCRVCKKAGFTGPPPGG